MKDTLNKNGSKVKPHQSKSFFSSKNATSTNADSASKNHSFFNSPDTSSAIDIQKEPADADVGATGVDQNRPLLAYGTQGSSVVFLQQRLNHFGADLEEDGIFGSLTYEAVREFQGNYAPPVDGVVGPITWSALEGNLSDLVDEEDRQVDDADLRTLGLAFLAVKDNLLLKDPLAAMMYGPVLESVSTRLLSPSQDVTTRQGFVPDLTMQVDQQPETLTKEEILKTQLDFILKLIALDDGGFSPDFMAPTLEERMAKKVIFLHSVIEGVKPDDLKPLAKEEADLFLERVRLMRDFYDGFLPNSVFTTGPQANKQPLPAGPEAARRTTLISLALSDVGKVRSHETPRFGSDHLKHIYDTAYPDHKFTDEQFKRFNLIPAQAHGGDGNTERDWIGSWCGIGAMYWLILAGETHHKWKEGKSGLTNTLKLRPFNQKPQIGDLVVNSREDHHGIITWIDPGATLPSFATPFGPTGQWKNMAIKTVESNVNNGQILHAPAGHNTLGYFDRGAFLPFK